VNTSPGALSIVVVARRMRSRYAHGSRRPAERIPRSRRSRTARGGVAKSWRSPMSISGSQQPVTKPTFQRSVQRDHPDAQPVAGGNASTTCFYGRKAWTTSAADLGVGGALRFVLEMTRSSHRPRHAPTWGPAAVPLRTHSILISALICPEVRRMPKPRGPVGVGAWQETASDRLLMRVCRAELRLSQAQDCAFRYHFCSHSGELRVPHSFDGSCSAGLNVPRIFDHTRESLSDIAEQAGFAISGVPSHVPSDRASVRSMRRDYQDRIKCSASPDKTGGIPRSIRRFCRLNSAKNARMPPTRMSSAAAMVRTTLNRNDHRT